MILSSSAFKDAAFVCIAQSSGPDPKDPSEPVRKQLIQHARACRGKVFELFEYGGDDVINTSRWIFSDADEGRAFATTFTAAVLEGRAQAKAKRRGKSGKDSEAKSEPKDDPSAPDDFAP